MKGYVFRRVEKKYLLNKKQKEAFLKDIKDYIERDDFYKSDICNIYFDNINNDMISSSLEKPIFKAKLRVRSYEVPKIDDYVFLEIKNKYKGVVGKRRIKLKLKDFYNYLENDVMEDTQIMKEIDYYFKYYGLKPYIFVAYDRVSYRSKDDENLRITIDSNLRSRKEDLRLELGNHGEKYFDDDTYIMEIKVLDSMPLWLTSILSKNKIYTTSFSKVGNIYRKVEEM